MKTLPDYLTDIASQKFKYTEIMRKLPSILSSIDKNYKILQFILHKYS